jgi:hypothetical protein
MPELLTNDSQNRAKLILNASVSSSSISWVATVTDGNASYGGWGLAGATLTVNVNGVNRLNESNKSYDFGGNTGSDTVVANAFFPKAGRTFTGTVSGLSASTSYNVNATFGSTGRVGTATISFNVTTSAPAVPPAPTWQTGTTLPTATRGTSYSANVVASPVNNPTYTLVSQSANTRGLSFSGNTISGTPTSVGTVTFTVRANNGGSTSDRTFSITINPALPVFSDASVNNLATRNIAYSDSVAASETASYSVRNSDNTGPGTLPNGLFLTTTGVEAGIISGTPTTIGSTSFRLRATNVTGNTDTEILTIQVRNNLGKRRTSSGFENIETSRRFNGTAWVATTVSKRFNGTAWVDISNS